MQVVEITVNDNGQVVKLQVEQVDGTLEQMEERIDAMSRELAAAKPNPGSVLGRATPPSGRIVAPLWGIHPALRKLSLTGWLTAALALGWLADAVVSPSLVRLGFSVSLLSHSHALVRQA